MINNNFGHISHCFRHTVIYSLKLLIQYCRQTAADGDIVTINTL